ncbi:DUF2251 domain-containing protein [Pseudomonas mohnii]
MHVGQGSVTEAPAEVGTYVVVFEDDEDTGYFYALDTAAEGNPIQDALHIYNVADVSDKHKPSSVKIGWSVDHSKAALLINDYPHAIFDFTAKQGYCRTDSHRKVTMAGPSVATNGMMRRVRKHGDLNRNVRHGVFSHAQNSTWPAWSPGEKRQERHPGFECHDSHNVYYVKPDAMLEMFMRLIRH